MKFKIPTMKLPVGVAVYRADGNPITVSICRFNAAMVTPQLLTHCCNS
jgi:hypothetical protein